ncbi:UNKNOWN [Stylonychia lemnae]|uniref:B box-type domain-containing protein n=1 Tax=Stylonychia lemnae TaxID=5949 RepID=A0A078AWM8_STYLE|nr:UNKNOWN [Stylonychia lemnae]|eukprot:CDW85213.1 UNKNOWN [Stylonychia lemnae]
MEEDIQGYINSINLIKKEFELCKMQINLKKAQKQKIILFLKDEEQKQFNSANLYQVYQGEWQKQTHQRCEFHRSRPLQLYCWTDLKSICEKCLIEEHINHNDFLDNSPNIMKQKIREIDKVYIQTVLLQQQPLTLYSKHLSAFQRMIVMDCQLDSLQYQIYNHPANDYLFELHNYYQKLREFETNFNQCKSICLTRKEEINLELMRWIDFDSDEPSDISADIFFDDQFLNEIEGSKQEPLYLGEKLRVQINEYMHSKEFFEHRPIAQADGQLTYYNFSKIEEILTYCQQTIAESEPSSFQNSKEEKIAQIQLLHDKAHEYKIKHADAWKSEEDSKKRHIRLQNLVELFKICELLKDVVENQTQLPLEREEAKRQEREIEQLERNGRFYQIGDDNDNNSDISLQYSSSGKKKKNKNKNIGQTNQIVKNEDFEKLKIEAYRLHTQVGNDQKPYIPKQESENKIIKFNKGFRIQRTLYNETFEVIYFMAEIEGFLITGHSKGILMIWDHTIGERVIKYECNVKDPVTSIVYMKSSIIWISLMNGDMILLRVNGLALTLDQMNQVKIQEPAKKIYSLTKLGDGRVCVSQDKGFTVWQLNFIQKQTTSQLSMQEQIKMQQQSKQILLEDFTVSQILEYDVNQVIVSTMSCIYFLISLKTGQVIHKIQGLGKYCLDLIRVPHYEQMGVKNIYCGVENEFYILIDVENEKIRRLQSEGAENQSPWYTGALFLRNKTDCMVVAEEKKRSIRSFVVNNLY